VVTERLAARWDAEYRRGRYRDEPPVAMTGTITRHAERLGITSGVYIGCGNGRNFVPLRRSGLDLTAWTAPQILAALNADMHETGWSWPNRIERPGAFLASRLRRLPPRPLAVTPREKPTPAAENPAPPPASATTRAAAIAYFRTHRSSDGARCAIGAGGEENLSSAPSSHPDPSAANALRSLPASVSTAWTP
jgi:hypothetical protein